MPILAEKERTISVEDTCHSPLLSSRFVIGKSTGTATGTIQAYKRREKEGHGDGKER